ncbi:cupin domain-containing protein [Ruminococcaceae bacterium OttesenSCG-928-I18]|nr:cupin domain-containing protein [Ruminococcaceae bacterium OttesenSCG-928-I18]
MSEEIREIAARIRELREISDYSVESMAQELGIDAELYKSYEASGGNIPISTLYHIANLFGVSMAEILTGNAPHIDTFCVVPAGKGEKVDRYPGYNFQGLAYKFRNKIMEPMVVTVDPTEGDPELVQHRGQELNFVLEGRIEVIYDDKRLLLAPGDSIYFDPTHAHGQKAMDGKPAKFLTVITE